MLAYVDMQYSIVESNYGNVRVKVFRNGGGRVSFGYGHTEAEAIANAANNQEIDWYSVREKVLTADCNAICHL